MIVEVHLDTRATLDLPDVTEAVEAGLARHRQRVTRVEVHLSDVHGPRGGADVRCAMEARPAGLHPVAVTDNASSPAAAIKGAVEKMGRLLEHSLGKAQHLKGNISSSGLPT